MTNTKSSTWRIAFAVFAGVTAANVLLRCYDAFMERQRLNEITNALHRAAKQNEQAEENTLRQQLLKRAEDQAAEERIQKRVAEELERRANQQPAPDQR